MLKSNTKVYEIIKKIYHIFYDPYIKIRNHKLVNGRIMDLESAKQQNLSRNLTKKEFAIFDTSINSENLGDYVIADFCNYQLRQIFGNYNFERFSTHTDVDSRYYEFSDYYKILCGTNILYDEMESQEQWMMPTPISTCRNVILFGVGWNNYTNLEITDYTKDLYNYILTKDYLHSVRDSYTEHKLKSIGINNVINTACPTMWNLTKDFCSTIPSKKGRNVIATVTDYRKDKEKDKALFDCLFNNYEKVFVWIQGTQDLPYLKKIIDISKIEVVDGLDGLDQVLRDEDSLDYVGTRLHAGIRSLNFKRRTIIIGVDNRSIEISKDTNLKIIRRENVAAELNQLINSEFNTNIELPYENIEKWKNQFKEDK